MTVKLLYANNKGGTGKTSTAVQTAAALARRRLRVLVVDMDPQGNATRRLGIEWDPTDPFVGTPEVLAANQKGAGEAAVYGCGWTVSDDDSSPSPEAELIDVIASRPDLINRETETGLPGAALRLRKALTGDWIEKYDVVIIDSQPDLGHLVQMSMVAADHVLLVTDAMRDGVEGTYRVDDYVKLNAEDLGNPDLKVAGVLVNRWKPTNEAQFYLDEWLRPRFGDLIWDLKKTENRQVTTDDGTKSASVETVPSWIPDWSRFAEADGSGVSLTRWGDQRARQTVAIYDQIADRIINTLIPVGDRA
ncbi:Cobyrinic acid ac-diamide synthase (plasmid) [Xylanimonas cellulosilytica DSM 15894]|uniref:Cobyrinic acid ac-diamide synthase n=1 Tax=Xylanimonas cellulosilytica (strain DSM 15894 / JCM 12276 / CECT 5975 / KCTC 9989 / LMG 20990 / NBRC 107835 / XIL07) TaxID=446471 RepID=D1C0U8_XYLCX|nr:AAA family ATPase [Xylanimonas cellulosilytica]ACZ32414.1 Cobyrinic acid ac-diamide synthase [Xylanimonas cellulosilytica DSM 15894]